MAERTASSLIVAAARIGWRRRHTEPAGACGVAIIAGVARTADAPVGSAGLAHAGTNVALGTRALARFEEAYWEGRDAAILPSRATRCRCNVRDSESASIARFLRLQHHLGTYQSNPTNQRRRWHTFRP